MCVSVSVFVSVSVCVPARARAREGGGAGAGERGGDARQLREDVGADRLYGEGYIYLYMYNNMYVFHHNS